MGMGVVDFWRYWYDSERRSSSVSRRRRGSPRKKGRVIFLELIYKYVFYTLCAQVFEKQDGETPEISRTGTATSAAQVQSTDVVEGHRPVSNFLGSWSLQINILALRFWPQKVQLPVRRWASFRLQTASKSIINPKNKLSSSLALHHHNFLLVKKSGTARQNSRKCTVTVCMYKDNCYLQIILHINLYYVCTHIN